jgi:hypothetical protein
VAYYALLDPSGSLSDPSGYRLFADLLAGTNGSFAWAPELYVGSTSDDATSAQRMWDGNLDDGFDSDSVFVSFDASLASGSATLSTSTADSSPDASYTGTTGGTIGSVLIRAGAQVPGDVDWSDISVTFWNGSQQGETINISAGPDANAADSSTGVAEQTLVVTPASSNYNHVTVSGALRMQAPTGVWPGGNDLFGQILIMPATA